MDKELSNLDLDYLYSKTNINDHYTPDHLNIMSTWKNDEDRNVKSFETIKGNPFGNNGHIVLFHRWNDDGKSSAHWIPIIRNRNNDVVIFDSLGDHGILKDKEAMNMILDKLKPYVGKVFINKKQYQKSDTNTCGKYSIYVISLNKMLHGANIEEIQHNLNKYRNVDKYLLKLFSKAI